MVVLSSCLGLAGKRVYLGKVYMSRDKRGGKVNIPIFNIATAYNVCLFGSIAIRE